MAPVLFLKLFAIFVTIALGWAAGRTKVFGGGEAARILSNAAFYLFAPALLFRATARVDLGHLPWTALAAFFMPVLAWMLLVYAQQRRGAGHGMAVTGAAAARPTVRAITAAYGNNAQLGIPMAAALFGEAGLQLHVALVSVHALILLSLLTVLVERDVAHAAARRSGADLPVFRLLAVTARNTLIHPIVLPVLLGLAWNLAALPLPAAADEVLQMLGTAVVPLCLVAIGLSLGLQGRADVRAAARGALWLAGGKLLVLPVLVLACGLALGLRGLPLTVIVMAAALPTGSNALMFAQRYRSNEGETTATIVLATLGFALTAPLWLIALQALGG